MPIVESGKLGTELIIPIILGMSLSQDQKNIFYVFY